MGDSSELVGTWVSDPSDNVGIREFGRATLDFQNDGRLTYTIHARNKDQKMLLTFRVEAGYLITDQPSFPREQRTSYEIGADGKLTLDYEGVKAVYIHQKNI